MNDAAQRALESMGYHLKMGTFYCKPFGYMLIIYDTRYDTLASYFKAANDGSNTCMERKKDFASDNDFPTILNKIKEFECYSKLNIGTQSNYELDWLMEL